MSTFCKRIHLEISTTERYRLLATTPLPPEPSAAAPDGGLALQLTGSSWGKREYDPHYRFIYMCICIHMYMYICTHFLRGACVDNSIPSFPTNSQKVKLPCGSWKAFVGTIGEASARVEGRQTLGDHKKRTIKTTGFPEITRAQDLVA